MAFLGDSHKGNQSRHTHEEKLARVKSSRNSLGPAIKIRPTWFTDRVTRWVLWIHVCLLYFVLMLGKVGGLMLEKLEKVGGI